MAASSSSRRARCSSPRWSSSQRVHRHRFLDDPQARQFPGSPPLRDGRSPQTCWPSSRHARDGDRRHHRRRLHHLRSARHVAGRPDDRRHPDRDQDVRRRRRRRRAATRATSARKLASSRVFGDDEAAELRRAMLGKRHGRRGPRLRRRDAPDDAQAALSGRTARRCCASTTSASMRSARRSCDDDARADEASAADTDLLMFSDFNYGCLPQTLVDAIAAMAPARGSMTADSQASSQMSDISRFRGHDAGHAHRARSAPCAAGHRLRPRRSRAATCGTRAPRRTLSSPSAPRACWSMVGQNGGEQLTDRAAGVQHGPKDVAGAGDSLFTAARWRCVAGADIWRSAYLGSVAAACQVPRVGNSPLNAKDILDRDQPGRTDARHPARRRPWDAPSAADPRTVPKCLVPIHGKPLLDYWLEHLFAAAIERALVNTHWLPDAVRAHVAASRSGDRVDLVHEPELLGTGGTVVANRAWLGEGRSFLPTPTISPTSMSPASCARIRRGRARCAMTMLAFRTDMPTTCGILGLGRGRGRRELSTRRWRIRPATSPTPRSTSASPR